MFLTLRNAYTKDDWFGRGLRCLDLYVVLDRASGSGVYGWAGLTTDGLITWLGLAGASVVIDRYWKR